MSGYSRADRSRSEATGWVVGRPKGDQPAGAISPRQAYTERRSIELGGRASRSQLYGKPKAHEVSIRAITGSRGRTAKTQLSRDIERIVAGVPGAHVTWAPDGTAIIGGQWDASYGAGKTAARNLRRLLTGLQGRRVVVSGQAARARGTGKKDTGTWSTDRRAGGGGRGTSGPVVEVTGVQVAVPNDGTGRDSLDIAAELYDYTIDLCDWVDQYASDSYM